MQGFFFVGEPVKRRAVYGFFFLGLKVSGLIFLVFVKIFYEYVKDVL